MTIRSMGEFAEAAGKLRTIEKKNHAGTPVFGILNPSVHVRFFTVDENADKIARYGIDEQQTVGTFVGERYSSDILAGVINHRTNPLGFDPSVFPYVPTFEDGQDCRVVDGLWSQILQISAVLFPPVVDPVPPTGPPPPQGPLDRRIVAFLKFREEIIKIAVLADSVLLRPNGGGVPSQTLLAVRTKLRASLNSIAAIADEK